jgi:hypothetical protein
MIAIGRQMTVNLRSLIPVFRQIADILLAQIGTGETQQRRHRDSKGRQHSRLAPFLSPRW